MKLELFTTVLLLVSSAQAFSPKFSNVDTAGIFPSCTARSMELKSSVNSYHSSLSENKILFSQLTNQVDSLRSDISKLKGGASGPPQNYSFAGKKDYRVRPWYKTNDTVPAFSQANGSSQSYLSNGSTSATAVKTSLVNGDITVNGLGSELLMELQAVSAELQKVAIENEALKQIQAMHEERERELQEQVSEQLAIFNRAERELEQVKAQSLKQLEATNRQAAARLAAETSEFKARLLEAERMVFKMKNILEKVEARLDIKLLDDSTRNYSVNGQTEKSYKRWGGKVKKTWGKVKSAFLSKGDAHNVNGASTHTPMKKYDYEQPMPANPGYQISRVEKVAS